MSAATERLLADALRTMLTAVDESSKESFPGHHKAFKNTVAIPRAKAALAHYEEEQKARKPRAKGGKHG